MKIYNQNGIISYLCRDILRFYYPNLPNLLEILVSMMTHISGPSVNNEYQNLSLICNGFV